MAPKIPRKVKNHWFIAKEGKNRFSIRRSETLSDGRRVQPRYPREKYKHIETDFNELEDFVRRLNQDAFKPEIAWEKVLNKHAFISPKLLGEFHEYLNLNIPSQNYASGVYGYVVNHFLKFFMEQQKLSNPTDWHKIHKTEWVKYLNKTIKAPKTKRAIVQASNRFIAWLHEKKPDIPKLVFEPFSRTMYNTLKSYHELNPDRRNPTAIPDTHWKLIEKRINDDFNDIKPFAYLGYHYGLRRAETLGVNTDDVREGYLFIQRQVFKVILTSADKKKIFTKPLKGKTSRKVPHWFSTPDEIFSLIEQIPNLMVHPDTLGQRWAELMKELKLTYTFHDLRHSWTTNALRKAEPRDVQMSAGHKNIQTTMGYAHDDRDMKDKKFIPKRDLKKVA